MGIEYKVGDRVRYLGMRITQFIGVDGLEVVRVPHPNTDGLVFVRAPNGYQAGVYPESIRPDYNYTEPPVQAKPPVKPVEMGVPHGGKDDSKKLDLTLLFAGMPNALEGVARVLGEGAKKYAAHSWRKVENGLPRYHAALLRHIHDLNKHGLDHINTEDFGLPSIDHAICDLLFMRELLTAEGKIK